MATLLSSFRTSLGYRLQDTGSPASYDSTQRDAWFNRGMNEVFRECPWALTNANLTGVNGTAYEFELSTILTRFHRLRAVSIPTSGGAKMYRDPRGISALREIQMGGGPLAGVPSIYFVQNTKLFFNRIPENGTTITIDFWQLPSDLSDAAHALGGLAATGWDELFLEMAALKAGRDIKGTNKEFGMFLIEEATEFIYGKLRSDGKRMYGELDKFKDFVKSELDEDAESLALPYSDLGGIDGVSRVGVTIPGTSPSILGSDYF